MRKIIHAWLGQRQALINCLVKFAVLNCIICIALFTKNLIHLGSLHNVQASDVGVIYYLPVWIFNLSASIGHSALLIGGILCVFCAIPLLCSRQAKFTLPLAVTACSLMLTTLILDSHIYNLFHFHLNGIILKLVLSSNAQAILGLSRAEWLFAGSLLSGVFIFESILAYWLWQRSKKTWRLSSLLLISAGSLLLSYFLLLAATFDDEVSAVALLRNHALAVNARALPLYHNALHALLPKQVSLRQLELEGSAMFAQPDGAAQRLQYPLHPLTFGKTQKPYNIVIIAADAWRRDMLNQRVTPNANAFALNNLVFTQHFSGGNATQPGLFSLFYSLPNSYWNAMLQQQRGPVFIHQLLQQHYQLGIFTSAINHHPPYNQTLYREVPNLRTETPGDTPSARDAYIVKEFNEFIGQRDKTKPFFSFVFFNTSHSYCDEGEYPQPFQPAIKQCRRYKISDAHDPLPYFNRYRNALHYVDSLMGQMLQSLRQQHLLDNTIVIMTGDHGEEFNDNHQNYWGHASAFSSYQLATPLVVHWPGKRAQFITHMTSHYDIVPTLMGDVLNCQNPSADYAIGKSLFTADDNDFLLVASYINSAIRTKQQVTEILPSGNYLIYDLHYKPMLNAKLNVALAQKAFNLMQRFYQRT